MTMEKTVKENLEKISYLINEAKSKSKYKSNTNNHERPNATI